MVAAAFCTISDLAAFLQVTIPGGSPAATAAIENASAVIQNYCNQLLVQVADDEITLDSYGIGRLFLPELPVTAVASIVEDGTELVLTDDYRWTPLGILERAGRMWGTGLGLVVVTYTHGYATIPIDIRAVCTRAAARSYQAGLRAAASSGTPGVQSERMADYDVQYATEQTSGGESMLGASAAPLLLRSEKEILDRYRYRGLA